MCDRKPPCEACRFYSFLLSCRVPQAPAVAKGKATASQTCSSASQAGADHKGLQTPVRTSTGHCTVFWSYRRHTAVITAKGD